MFLLSPLISHSTYFYVCFWLSPFFLIAVVRSPLVFVLHSSPLASNLGAGRHLPNSRERPSSRHPLFSTQRRLGGTLG